MSSVKWKGDTVEFDRGGGVFRVFLTPMRRTAGGPIGVDVTTLRQFDACSSRRGPAGWMSLEDVVAMREALERAEAYLRACSQSSQLDRMADALGSKGGEG